jgi:predicted O-methyltransferase YrrM
MNRFLCKNRQDAFVFLLETTLGLCDQQQLRNLVLVGELDGLARELLAAWEAQGIRATCYEVQDLDRMLGGAVSFREVACVVCTYPDARRTTAVAARLLEHPEAAGTRFEYIALPLLENWTLVAKDVYRDEEFISPLHLDPVDPFRIYLESLEHFDQKCGIRDYMDLFQLLRNVISAPIEGDIAEFGSFRGHSGYLIARTLEAMGSDKRLFMFDTFEHFPEETAGIDLFWNGSHPVAYQEVKAKFEPLPWVSLVKGDFRETLGQAGLSKLALAYVDCDSFNATRFLLENLYEERLSTGGILVIEDYGHAPLLGSRVAVHRFFDGKRGCVKFFSQFSGFYFVIKV